MAILSSGRKQKSPRLPEGVRIYAIGDIHGRADLLDRVFARIDAHVAAHPIARPVEVFIGDYIDRGPASFEVIEQLIRREQSHEIVPLKGNHDTFVFEFLRRPSALQDWSLIGGRETLLSYRLKPFLNPDPNAQKELSIAMRAALPKTHRMFFSSLQTSFSCGGYFFVHAGVRPRIALADQREEDLLWIRDDFLLWEQPFEKVIIHGHTPVREVDIRPNRINIDTGAYATGQLTCLMMEREAVEPLIP